MPPRLQTITVLATEACHDSFLIPEGAGVFDVTGGLTMTVARSFDHAAPLAVLSTANARLTFDPDAPDGVFSLDLPVALVASWPAGHYVYTLVGIDGGDPVEICRGDFVVSTGRTSAAAIAPILNLRETAARAIMARKTADLRLAWRLVDEAPLDLTGWTAKLTVRPAFGHAAAIASWATGSGLSGAADGLLTLVRPQAVTADLPAGSWVYMLVLSGPAGVFEIARGPFEVPAGIA